MSMAAPAPWGTRTARRPTRRWWLTPRSGTRHTPNLGAPRIPMHYATMHQPQLAAVYVRGAVSRASSCAPEEGRAVCALSAAWLSSGRDEKVRRAQTTGTERGANHRRQAERRSKNLNPPAFDAHLHSWEGAFRGEQVRPGDSGQGCPFG